MQEMAKIDPGKVQGLLQGLNPQQMSGVRRHLSGEVGAGAAALGLSGLVSGGSAYMQYGKGQETARRYGGQQPGSVPQQPGLLSNLNLS
jgi:hypothetical protein